MKMSMSGARRVVAVFAAAAVIAVCGGEAFADDGVKFSTDFNFVAATTLEMKAKLIESARVPFLVGDGPLFSGNNLTFTGIVGVSPVSVTGHVQAHWTPIAVLEFYGEAGLGTGWNLPIATGLALTNRGSDGLSSFEKQDFGGIVWNAKAGGTFQFDFAAVFPGDWNHVVVQSSHEMKYRAYTGAAAGQAWCYEADDGDNRNGWSYYGNVFLGYQMPIFLDTVGILAEDEMYLYNVTGGDVWGDSLPRYTFGPLLNFKLSDRLSIAALVQARTRRTYTSGTEKTYYEDRVVDQTNPLHIEFYRAALNLTYHIN
jgi:hypothetical protein